MNWFRKKKKAPIEQSQSKLDKLLISREIPKDNLSINIKENIVNIHGKSITEDDRVHWIEFLGNLQTDILDKFKFITINFYVDLFNSSQGQYVTKLFDKLSSNNYKCHAIINWHYITNDEFMMEYGIIHKENFPLIEINLIEL